ncbi:MAG: NUDIX domain-containing protein [Acidocella sp.]|nr:NUDIX domain-containing protein [Acidocella sp.]
MACDLRISKLLSHINACRSATLPGGRLKFYIGNHHAGYVWPDFARILAGVSPDMTLTDRLVLAAHAAPRLNEIAAAAGARVRFENFDVREAVGGPVLAVLDRGALPSFGVVGVGVHLNGLVKRPDGWHLWVAKRAADKKLDPGKLDHLVAGGVAAGHTPFETLVKESEEEAALPAALAAQAKQVGCFAYNMERPEGLRRDVIYAYDVVLPEDFIPQPADGEVESFALWPLAEVFERVSSSDDFKFNVNFVLADLFVRFGLVTGEGAVALRAALAGA